MAGPRWCGLVGDDHTQTSNQCLRSGGFDPLPDRCQITEQVSKTNTNGNCPMKRIRHSYYVVMIDYGRLGLEAIVQPEVTRREVVARIVSGEYQDISFIHLVEDGLVDDVTTELLDEAEQIIREAA